MRFLPFVVLLACGTPSPTPEAPDASPDHFQPASEAGAFDAGRFTLTVEDGRGDPVTVEVWYPARAPEGAEPTAYEVPITLEAYEGAPPARDAGPFPLVVFTHGWGGIRMQSAFLTEHLARHGFVVVAPDHEGSILLESNDFSGLADNLARRPSDVSRSVDAAMAASARDGEYLSGLIASDEYLLMGHSMGAVTALIVGGGAYDVSYAAAWCDDNESDGCSYLSRLDESDLPTDNLIDPRVQAVVAMSPGGWYAFGEDGNGLGDLPPTFVLAGTSDGTLGYEGEAVPTYEALGEHRWLATIQDAGHYAAFSDMCLLLFDFQDCKGPDEGFLDSATGQAITRTLVTSWVGILHGDEPRYADAFDEEALAAFPALTFEGSGPVERP